MADEGEQEHLHTMPSFREGEDDCEKTLSVIYDDTDLARDHLQSFGYTHQYVTQDQAGSPTRAQKTPSESI